MIRVSENSLLNISRYENDLARLSFISQSGMAFSMNRLNANMMSSTHAEFLSDFENDITDTASMIEKLQKAINASNGDYISDGINLGDLFDIDRETGTIEVLGFGIKKGVTNVDKARIKKRLVEKIINIDYEDYKAALKVARSKKADEVSLPINPSEKEKFLYLALKAVGGRVYKVTSKIQKELNSYRKLRMDYTPEELNLIDSKINGFTRTMVDGVIQNSTYFTANEVVQISTKHQKDIGAMNYVKKMQEQLKNTGILSVEVDSDDSLEKMHNLLKDAEFFTLNTKSGFTLKSRKLGNYAGSDTTLFGMFLPSSKIIAVDSRDPSALSHEYAHAIDYNNDFLDPEIRSGFILAMTSFLNKKYFFDYTSGDVVNSYLTLKEGAIDKIKENIPKEAQSFIYFDEVSMAEQLLSREKRIKAANRLESSLINSNEGYTKDQARRLREQYINSFDGIDVLDFGGERYADLILKRGNLTSVPGIDKNIVDYVKTRGVKEFEKIDERPRDYHYLYKPTEIIARAGEIGFVLSKYGYEGHSSQEELDLFFDKIRKIQEQEIKTSKKIRGCHEIDKYLERDSYFGIRDMNEDTLLLIKEFYQPFFKPNRILDITNNEINEKTNNVGFANMSNERFRELLESIMLKEFKEEIKRKTERNSRRVKGKRFNKDEYPLSHLTNFSDLESMIKANEEENIVSNNKLATYIFNNIKYLGRTQKNENIELDKIKRRLDTFAMMLSSADSFDGFSDSLNLLKMAIKEPKNNNTQSGLANAMNDKNEEIKLISTASSDIMSLSLRGSEIGVKELALDLSRLPADEIELSYDSFNELLQKGKALRKESNERNSKTLDLEFIASESMIEEVKSLIEEDIKGIRQAKTLEGKSYYYLKAMKRLSPVTTVVDWKDDYGAVIDEVDFSKSINKSEELIIKTFVDLMNKDVKDFHYEDRKEAIKSKVRYMRPRDTLMTYGVNQEVDFNIFNDDVKVKIFDWLREMELHGDVFSAKSHSPKKSISDDEEKIAFLNSKKFNNIKRDIIPKMLDIFYEKGNLSNQEIKNLEKLSTGGNMYSVRQEVANHSRDLADEEDYKTLRTDFRKIEDFLEKRGDYSDLVDDLDLFKKEYGKSKVRINLSSKRSEPINSGEINEKIKGVLEDLTSNLEVVAKEEGINGYVQSRMAESVLSKKDAITPIAITYASVKKAMGEEGNVFEKIITNKNEGRDKKIGLR